MSVRKVIDRQARETGPLRLPRTEAYMRHASTSTHDMVLNDLVRFPFDQPERQLGASISIAICWNFSKRGTRTVVM